MPLTGDRRPRPVPAGGNADAPAVPACVYDEQSEQEPLRQKRQEGVSHEAIAQKSAVCQLFQLIEELFPLAPRTEQTYAYNQQAQADCRQQDRQCGTLPPDQHEHCPDEIRNNVQVACLQKQPHEQEQRKRQDDCLKDAGLQSRPIGGAVLRQPLTAPLPIQQPYLEQPDAAYDQSGKQVDKQRVERRRRLCRRRVPQNQIDPHRQRRGASDRAQSHRQPPRVAPQEGNRRLAVVHEGDVVNRIKKVSQDIQKNQLDGKDHSVCPGAVRHCEHGADTVRAVQRNGDQKPQL